MIDWRAFAGMEWERALEAHRAAKAMVEEDLADSAANRAYYVAFHAVSALFALGERSFNKHSGVSAAVHRDLVHAGLWPKELGDAYSELMAARQTGDYGGFEHVTSEEAEEAIELASRILEAVHAAHPDIFLLPPT